MLPINTIPIYGSNLPKQYYDSFGEKEGAQLSRDESGESLYHVHMDVFRFTEKRVAGNFSLVNEDALKQAKADQELWDLLRSKEIEFSKME